MDWVERIEMMQKKKTKKKNKEKKKRVNYNAATRPISAALLMRHIFLDYVTGQGDASDAVDAGSTHRQWDTRDA